MGIESNITKFLKESKGEHHRFRSWEHCYAFFQTLQKTDQHSNEMIDQASLHLGFYLASWGMYRASAFLFKRDYKVHKKIVREILKKKYKPLNRIKIDAYDDEKVKLLFDLIARIKKLYCGEAGVKRVSDTLVTKVLLGTLGCTPAYDNFLQAGLRKEKLHYSGLKQKNFKEFVAWCNKDKNKNSLSKNFSSGGVSYPFMKLVDMHFWVLGDGMKKKK